MYMYTDWQRIINNKFNFYHMRLKPHFILRLLAFKITLASRVT